jgi:hypothetical protein
MHKTIEQIVNEATNLAKDLLEKPRNEPGKIGYPARAGVYIIYCNDKHKKGIIYVGESGNLRKRIGNNGHLSASQKEVTSFRGRLNDDNNLNLKYGPQMKNWIVENCEFAFKDDDVYQLQDTRKLVEAILIAFLRAKGEPLLNKQK